MLSRCRFSLAAALRPLLVTGAVLAVTACGGGGGGDTEMPPGGGGDGNPSGAVMISGKAQYQFPPPVPVCRGLDFAAVELRPIRQATVQLLAATGNTVLDTAITDDDGEFSLSADPETRVLIRVRAELKKTGTPSWDVEVRDNTTTETAAGAPLSLPERPLYVLDSAAFDTGTSDQTHDVTATTGWSASQNRYTGTRAAAPFAVLDTVYSAIRLVQTAEPEVAFEPLDVFWSVNNRAADGSVDDGDIGTSHYQPGVRRLFLLGSAANDPDEFDDHVVAHEWGHFYEDAFSRSDSIGGDHMLGDSLDMRVAFGEGWATALSGMALDNPTYCDTTLDNGFAINIEGGANGTPGWFNEISVMKVIYDLWDENIDGVDSGSLGFEPIHAVMTEQQAATPAFTSIFSFADALRVQDPAGATLLDALLAAEQISGTDLFGGGEANHGGAGTPEDVLPVYTEVAPDGVTREICSNSEFDAGPGGDATGNKLGEHRFLRMTLTRAAQYHFEIITNDNTDLPADDPNVDNDQSDPDILIQLNGVEQNAPVTGGNPQGFSPEANHEIFTTSNVLEPGEYVLALTEFRYDDPETPQDYPARTCFDVTITEAL
ncbi:MAG TPA: carboxypeptidase-like regulatory domain-containing protein [Woeseiaceae bacterium]